MEAVAERVGRLIEKEREKQDHKWGVQNHSTEMWLMILTEELGELAEAHLANNHTDYILELIQVAAVAQAWLECEIRNGNR